MAYIDSFKTPFMSSLLESDHAQVVLQQIRAYEAPLLRETHCQATAAIGKAHTDDCDALRWLTSRQRGRWPMFRPSAWCSYPTP